jgi:hypothetical protein
MMKRRSSVVALVLGCAVFAVALAAASCEAATTTTVVDIATRGVVQRFLYVRPDAPIANIVFLPGNTGILGIRDDGSMPTIAGRCAPIVRTRDALASHGFALALVDQASDGKVRQLADVREVVRYVRDRDRIPTWIVGGSASTNATIENAVELSIDAPLGVVVFGPGKHDVAKAALVRQPTLVIYHRDDAFSAPLAQALFDALTSARVRERIALTGGIETDECGGYHLFRGIDADFAAAISGFIDRNSGFPRSNR